MNAVWSVLMATLCAAAVGCSFDTSPRGRSDATTQSGDAGAARDDADAGAPRGYKSFADLPECDRLAPSFACVRELYLPLRETAWPFDGARVARALGRNEFSVADGWDLTAHHVLAAHAPGGTYGCFFGAFRYAEGGSPFSEAGCGEMLVAGGHPHALECKTRSASMGECVDEVAFEESFDLVVTRGPRRSASLDLAPGMPRVGDVVFAVGRPAFDWLPIEERVEMSSKYPLVSYGRVVRADGRGIVADLAASPGNSGGPLVNARGEVVGVVSTMIRHQRERGTPVPADLLDHFVVASAPDEAARAIIADVQSDP